MATIEYQNGFTSTSSKNVEDHVVNGQQIMQVWTNPIQFASHGARRTYFSGSNLEHCLSVEFDEQEGEKWVVYFFDDQDVGIPPTKTVPSDEELFALLAEYG